MSDPSGKVPSGVFAVNKPPSISSAQVIRDLQRTFQPSTLFAPALDHERARRKEQRSRNQRDRRKDKSIKVKMGHGGTLDPMATGVLILGVEGGTKSLQKFLECTKTYDTTVVFGAATDTYDVLGKVLRRAPHGHVTRSAVEEALKKFRGKIMQRPPLYSALRMEGKRLYEYAREGKEIPREIEKRPVEVKELEIMEWLEPGTHEQPVPKEEAESESKDLAEKVLHLGEVVAPVQEEQDGQRGGTVTASTAKRKLSVDDEDGAVVKKVPKLDESDSLEGKALMSGALPVSDETSGEEQAEKDEASQPGPETGGEATSAPAVRLRMTVTSGFYVRSLSHDLGEAVGSLAYMSALVRTRQGGFELGQNVLEYDDLNKDESVWGPKVKSLLDAWHKRPDTNPEGNEEPLKATSAASVAG